MNTNIYKETQNLFGIVRDIMTDLPKVNDQVHIDSVNWVSHDGEFTVVLIQDYEHSGKNGSAKDDKQPLSQYSSKQLNVLHINHLYLSRY